MRIGILIALFFCITFLPGVDCRPVMDCPGFEDSLLVQWFPYKPLDSVKFTTATNSSRTFRVYSVRDSEPRRTKLCMPRRTIELAQYDLTDVHGPFRFELAKYITSDGRSKRNVFIDMRTQFFSGDFNDTGFQKPAIEPQYGKFQLQSYNSIQLNGKLFTEVQGIFFDTTASVKPAFQKIYISKRHGLIAYETYNPALLWVKE